jgi:hypothetical protein
VSCDRGRSTELLSALLLLLFIGINIPAAAQEQEDITYYLKRKIDTLKVKVKNSSLLVIPVITSSPATGVSFGAAGQISWFSKSDDEIRLSNVSSNFLSTTKNQTLIFAKSNIFALQNKLFLSGDWRYYLFSENTYGLGTNAPEGSIANNIFGLNGYELSNDSLTQPLTFNYFKFHQTFSYEVKENFFAGIGFHLDHYSKIKDLRLNESANYFTSHYLYSTFHSFDPKGYNATGISANFVYDTRDNANNAYEGWYANANLRYNPTGNNNSKESVMALLEVRTFKSLSTSKPRHVLAFWGIANWVVSGDIPYLVLPALGYDQRGRSGRAYAAGRFRGQELLYGEAEYRFPISPRTQILGGVLFANLITTTNQDNGVKLFNYLRTGYGAGLRLMVDKKTRTNLGVDVGLGSKSTGIYIVATEAF